MHSSLILDNTKNIVQKGVLYVVATPIGNLEDVTIRSIKVLDGVDVVAAEDTRMTGKLLAHYGISTRLVSYHEHNEKTKSEDLITKLKNGESIALVSDAGTPSVSDPGFRLVKAASENGVVVVPIPGVSAVITALCAAGLPTDSFVFAGFPPRKKGRRYEFLNRLSEEKRTLIFYESPKRIIKFIYEILDVLGSRPAVLGREMTKLHEEFLRGDLESIVDTLENRAKVKGECTLIVSGIEKKEVEVGSITDEICKGLNQPGMKPSMLAKELSVKYSIRKNKVYDKIQDMLNNSSN